MQQYTMQGDMDEFVQFRFVIFALEHFQSNIQLVSLGMTYEQAFHMSLFTMKSLISQHNV